MKKLDILKELSVLYVDDDKQACESLKHILQYYFKEVFIAYNGVEALEVFENKECHFLIVDYDMPLMDGYEFLSKVREIDEEIFAIIMSSYDDKVKLKNAIKLNLLEYMTKPYELNELQEVLKKLALKVEKNALLKVQITPECCYDKTLNQIIINNVGEQLTSYEVKVFEYLLKNQDKIVSYDQLLDILDSTSQKSLISIIYKINNKLPSKLIKNIKDIGYILK
ncbi:MAG: response regulator [Arcobacteraceae bacterium]|nr:response regulator [Arcobacteraceae bacterium]